MITVTLNADERTLVISDDASKSSNHIIPFSSIESVGGFVNNNVRKGMAGYGKGKRAVLILTLTGDRTERVYLENVSTPSDWTNDKAGLDEAILNINAALEIV